MGSDGTGIGRSEHSVLKQKHFAGVVEYLSRVAKRAMEKWEGVDPYYWIFDMNSARPFYPLQEDDDCGIHLPSSSVIGPKVAARNGHQVRAVLMEIDEGNVRELYNYYWPRRCSADFFEGRVHVDIHCGDSSELLSNYGRGTHASRFGYVYVDPNVPSIPKTLTEFYAHTCNQKIDLIINIAATSLKRQGLSLEQEIRQVMAYKRKWLIREPYGRHQWTMLIGTNWVKVNDWSAKGFHLLDTEAGRAIFDRVSKTKQELEAAERGQLEIGGFTQLPTGATPSI